MHTLLRNTVVLALLLTTTSVALAQGPGRGRGGPPPEPGLMTYELAAKAIVVAPLLGALAQAAEHLPRTLLIGDQRCQSPGGERKVEKDAK